MSAVTATLAGRRAAERQMIDSCTIARPGPSVEDPVTGIPAPSSTPVYSGRCKVQNLDPQEAALLTGGAVVVSQRYRVDIPVGAYSPAVGDVVTIVATVLDPNMVGRGYRVLAPMHKTAATAYRMAVTDAEVAGG